MADGKSSGDRSWYGQKYDDYYNSYVPWLEDKYLAWFGENKSSYMAKDTMSKTKVTGNKQVDGLQDGVAEGVGGQLGKGGLLNPVGEGISDQGVTRAERGDTGPLSTEEAQKQQKGYLGGASDAVKGAGSSMGGWLPGGRAK